MKPAKRAVLAATLSWLFAGDVPVTQAAGALPLPSGPVLLEITGHIGHRNADGAARFDRQMLEALGTTTLRTSTAWTTGEAEFEGVLARDLLAAVGAEGTTVTATALNDYATAIPIEELRRYPVMLALKMNGEPLKIRDKGPVWIVYPRDQHKELQDSLVDKRWVWQLKGLYIE
jgi:hypothetical protein